jgi:hypothetical protein
MSDEVKQRLLSVGLNAPRCRPDAETCRRIGEAFWAAGFPAMAGRYWYLLDDATDKTRSARQEFERSCGNNPFLMHFDLELTGPGGSGPRMTEIRQRARDLKNDLGIEIKQGRRIQDRAALVGCAIFAFAVFVLCSMGVTALYHGLNFAK